jgi:hypothetical protein
MNLFDRMPSPKRPNARQRMAIGSVVMIFGVLLVPTGILVSLKSPRAGDAVLVAACLVAARGLLFVIGGLIDFRNARKRGDTAGDMSRDPHRNLATSAKIASYIVDTLVDHQFIPKAQFHDAVASAKWELDAQHGMGRIILKDDRGKE